MFKPDKNQLEIKQFVEENQGKSVVIQSCPGSGKTTTITFLEDVLENAIYLSFLRANKEILIQKLSRNAIIKTINSVGNSQIYFNIGKCEINNWKYNQISRKLLSLYCIQNNKSFSYDEESNIAKNIDRLAGFSRKCLAESEKDIVEVAKQFGVSYHPFEIKLVFQCLEKGLEMALEDNEIDYTDQLWIPNKLDWKFRKKYKNVIIDEAQDLSPAQIGIVLKCMAKNSRIIAVGDKWQSIMVFAGARSNALDNIKFVSNAEELCLNHSYRCPTSHIDYANNVQYGIDKYKTIFTHRKKKGNIEYVNYQNMAKIVKNGDMVISRFNYSIVETAFALFKESKQVFLKGLNLAKRLNDFIDNFCEEISFSNLFYKTIPSLLKNWLNEIETKMKTLQNYESDFARIQDMAKSFETAYRMSNANTIEKLKLDIEQILGRTNSIGAIILCTIHKSKGDEAKNVFILNSNELPYYHRSLSEIELQQEVNVFYVAVTRSKKKLYMVNE